MSKKTIQNLIFHSTSISLNVDYMVGNYKFYT